MQAAKFADKDLFTGSSISFQTGGDLNNSTIVSPTYTFGGLDEDTLDITVNAAATSITYIDTTMNEVMNVRSEYAAFANRLESEIDYLSTSIISNTKSLSKIMDTDLALQTLQLTKSKVLENAALFALAKTAPQKSDILALYYDNSKVAGQGAMFL